MSGLPNWIINRAAPAMSERPAGRGITLRKRTDADVPGWEVPGTPVPSLGTVKGYSVVAFAEVPNPMSGPRAGEGSGVFVVIVYRPHHMDRYAVWTLGEFRTGHLLPGTPAPEPRSNGRYVATWERATEVLAERSASIGAAFFARV